MRLNGTPPHTPEGLGDDYEEGMNYDDDEEFDEDDMIEIVDDENDIGNLADDEEDEELSQYPIGPGMEGFTGQKPDHVLTSHMENAVFCCCFDGEGNKFITGGEDDLANVWDNAAITAQSPSFKCRGHKDSVVCVSFNWDSSYLSSCDLSGVVKVWATTNYDNVASFDAGELSWSFWHFASNVLFAGCDDGTIYMWKIPSGDCKIYAGSSVKCECGVLLPDGKRLLTGYTDGTLKIFDLKSGEIQHNLTKSFKKPSQVLCVAAHPTKQIIASGSANGTVALFNSENGKLFTTIQVYRPTSAEGSSLQEDNASEEINGSIEGLAFCPDPTLDLLACGSVAGDIVIWNLSTMTERMRLHQECGITKLSWNPTSPFLYSAGLDGAIRVIDARSCTIEKLLGRHKTEVLDMAVTKDGSRLASTSEDGTVFLFNLV